MGDIRIVIQLVKDFWRFNDMVACQVARLAVTVAPEQQYQVRTTKSNMEIRSSAAAIIPVNMTIFSGMSCHFYIGGPLPVVGSDLGTLFKLATQIVSI